MSPGRINRHLNMVQLQWDPYLEPSYQNSQHSTRSSTSTVGTVTPGSPARRSLDGNSMNMEPTDMYSTPERVLTPHHPSPHQDGNFKRSRQIVEQTTANIPLSSFKK